MCTHVFFLCIYQRWMYVICSYFMELCESSRLVLFFWIFFLILYTVRDIYTKVIIHKNVFLLSHILWESKKKVFLKKTPSTMTLWKWEQGFLILHVSTEYSCLPHILYLSILNLCTFLSLSYLQYLSHSHLPHIFLLLYIYQIRTQNKKNCAHP